MQLLIFMQVMFIHLLVLEILGILIKAWF